MELEGLKYIGIGLTALGFLGAALGIGNIFSTAISSIARNPSTESKISKYVFIGAGFAESMGLFALVIALILLFVA
ncbi:MAG: F0F1 ATP synthase subunit C [Rickettsiales bacterium]|nr:F0F1 ATP synthase subunit C [Rickettsiales bacterium]